MRLKTQTLVKENKELKYKITKYYFVFDMLYSFAITYYVTIFK